MKERIQLLIDIYGSSERKRYKEMESKTGVKSGSWQNACRGLQRINEDHLNGIMTGYPEHIYWVVTGKTAPEIGQFSPGTDEKESVTDQIARVIENNELSGNKLTPKETAELILQELNPALGTSESEEDQDSNAV